VRKTDLVATERMSMGATLSGGASRAIKIRKAGKKDIPAICEIMPAAFGLVGGSAWADPAYVATGLASCAAKLSSRERMMIATVDGTVAGCSFARRAFSADGETVWREIGVRGGVAVAPQFRRLGVGAALVQADEDYLRDLGARVMLVEVRQQAQQFFLNCGYVLAVPPIAVVAAGLDYVLDRTALSTMLMWRAVHGDVTVDGEPSSGTRLILGPPASSA
jgi:GNAT superfamily N-acetyltransferase